MMAGIIIDNEITATEADLLPGDNSLCYSDGVTEAFHSAGDMFVGKRLLEAAGRGSSLRVGELVATFHQAVADSPRHPLPGVIRPEARSPKPPSPV